MARDQQFRRLDGLRAARQRSRVQLKELSRCQRLRKAFLAKVAPRHVGAVALSCPTKLGHFFARHRAVGLRESCADVRNVARVTGDVVHFASKRVGDESVSRCCLRDLAIPVRRRRNWRSRSDLTKIHCQRSVGCGTSSAATDLPAAPDVPSVARNKVTSASALIASILPP